MSWCNIKNWKSVLGTLKNANTKQPAGKSFYIYWRLSGRMFRCKWRCIHMNRYWQLGCKYISSWLRCVSFRNSYQLLKILFSFALAFWFRSISFCTSLLNAFLKTRTLFYRVGITRLLLQSPSEYKEMLLNGILTVMSNLYKSLKICCNEFLCNVMNNSFKVVLDNETKFLLGLKWKHNMVSKIVWKKNEA